MIAPHAKVVALNGSVRKDENTAILLQYVLHELENEGIETEVLDLNEAPINPCTRCRTCFVKRDRWCAQRDDVGNVCIEKMARADGILLGASTDVTDISLQIESLMERACMVSKANGGIFRHKVGAAVVAAHRAGAVETFYAMNNFFLTSEMIVVGSSFWNIGYCSEAGDVVADVEGIQTMKTLGQNMAWLLKRLKIGRSAKQSILFAGAR
jgi:multimeric flavodoxin WrbA